MPKRKIIKINENKCTGCGLCIPNCPEGALQVIDGKARLVSDLLCDGLGACLGECPKGAIAIEEREAVPYNEKEVMANMLKSGGNTVKAHLKHLKEHGQADLLKQARDFLRAKGLPDPLEGEGYAPAAAGRAGCGCPGAREMTFGRESIKKGSGSGKTAAVGSQLRQWPVQLHLVSPLAAYFKKADVVLAADCAAYAYGDFHNSLLKGKALAIACPKLDDGREIYIEKIKSLIEDSQISTLTVVTMEVPCCGGLLAMAREALNGAKRIIPVKHVVIGIQGEIKSTVSL